jgi:hypothetical protein
LVAVRSLAIETCSLEECTHARMPGSEAVLFDGRHADFRARTATMKQRRNRFEMLYDTDPEGGAALADTVQACPPHHWIIDSPSGNNFSDANCKKCGEQRLYRNWLEQYEYSGVSWRAE